jgi:hypothetical protein
MEKGQALTTAWRDCSTGRQRAAPEYTLGFVEIGKIFFQIFQFGKIVVDDVGIFGIVLQIILMVVLGRVESFEGLDFGDDGRE